MEGEIEEKASTTDRYSPSRAMQASLGPTALATLCVCVTAKRALLHNKSHPLKKTVHNARRHLFIRLLFLDTASTAPEGTFTILQVFGFPRDDIRRRPGEANAKYVCLSSDLERFGRFLLYISKTLLSNFFAMVGR